MLQRHRRPRARTRYRRGSRSPTAPGCTAQTTGSGHLCRSAFGRRTHGPVKRSCSVRHTARALAHQQMPIVLLDHGPSRTAIRRRTRGDRLSRRVEFVDQLRGHRTFERFRFVERHFQFGVDSGFAPVRNRLACPREQVPIPRHRNWNQHDLVDVIDMGSIEFLVKARRGDIEVRNANVASVPARTASSIRRAADSSRPLTVGRKTTITRREHRLLLMPTARLSSRCCSTEPARTLRSSRATVPRRRYWGTHW